MVSYYIFTVERHRFIVVVVSTMLCREHYHVLRKLMNMTNTHTVEKLLAPLIQDINSLSYTFPQACPTLYRKKHQRLRYGLRRLQVKNCVRTWEA